jgi:hypothetical protein|tara:strand:+ start:16411 stop:16842 length:432 start_codon:yes stop_codon:yes gene_type:complete
MATVTYVGDRPYVEFSFEGTKYGFARGMSRVDIPELCAAEFEHDGFPQWAVTDLEASTTDKMLEVLEEPTPEPEPVIEEVVEEPTPEPAEEEPSLDFDPNWSRAEMIQWFKARGEKTLRTSTKASLTARAEALMNPPEESGDE